MEKNYTVNKGKVFSEKGIPHLPRWFCDNRLAVQVDRYGISAVQFIGILENINVFVKDMWGGMKFYINDHEERAYLDLYDTEMMPWGYSAKWKYNNNIFRFEQRVVNDSVLLTIEPIEVNSKNLNLCIEFYETFGLRPHPNADLRYRCLVERIWNGWRVDGNNLSTSFTEGKKNTFICITSDTELKYSKRSIGFLKHIINLGDITQKKVHMSMSFDNDKDKAFASARECANNSDKYIKEQDERYERVMKKAPVLVSPYKGLNDFFALAPVYHESFKLSEYPGAIRAKTNIYWVWGWDSMTASSAYTTWGDNEHVGNMLKFFMETADSEKGFMHAFHRDMSCREVSIIAAQGFYITLLYQYYINGGDITPFYSFAKKIFGLILSTEADVMGLSKGNSLVPDFRELILENGNDISCFNNTVAYCAVRSLEEMAKDLGDDETYKKASEFSKRMRKNFNKLLYDDEAGYYVSSADCVTLEKRPVYMGMEIKWENSFLGELVDENKEKCLKFFEKNFICKSGIRVFPKNGIGYDADSNQAHCWWPTHSEYYTKLINKQNRVDLMEQFIGWITDWTDILTCPEGINCYVDTDELFLDDWNAPKGVWQAYSIRAWYEAVVHSIVGVEVNKNGLRFYPYSGEEMSILGLHYSNKLLDIHMKGSGQDIEYIELNGVKYESTTEISNEQLESKNEIVVRRKNK